MRKKPITLAAAQLCCTTDVDANLKQALRVVDDAAAAGAELIALPENTLYLGPDDPKPELATKRTPGALRRFGNRAKKHGRWLLIGSMPEMPDDPSGENAGKVHNTSFLIAPDGKVAARYRKIHMFDVRLADGSFFKESDSIAPGDRTVTFDAPFARLGLTICYDLRFPEIYAALARLGAEILFVPSAFTLHTGRDHWEVLLRARAIETQTFVVAPAQWGAHGGGRKSYGRALIIDPWGVPLANASDGVGFCLAQLDGGRMTAARAQIPCGQHHRPDIFGA